MVKVTERYLCKKLTKKPQILRKNKDETDFEYLSRVTHLYLQSQFIDHIAPMTDCSSVTVIYLQDNQLQTIHNLDNFPNLSYLYLQKNHISRIENLSSLRHLKKLYLGSNEISVVEGLDQLDNLVELHIEGQRLPKGDTIYFDPRTMKSLGKTLKVLNISYNNITRIRSLSGLYQLEELIANDNKIHDSEDVWDTLPSLTSLRKLKLVGNPVASTRRYREDIILSSPSLKVLDDKEIRSETRNFVENLAMSKSRLQQEPKKVPQVPSHTQKIPYTSSGSMLFPLLKMHNKRMPRTSSTCSAPVPPHYYQQTLQTFHYTTS